MHEVRNPAEVEIFMVMSFFSSLRFIRTGKLNPESRTDLANAAGPGDIPPSGAE
jgi:hypothetical protein